jgi:tetratricopeptide (TPR) repeat protein
MSRVLKHLLKDENKEIEKIELELSALESSIEVAKEEPKKERPELKLVQPIAIEKPITEKKPKRRNAKVSPPPFKHKKKLKPINVIFIILGSMICVLYGLKLNRARNLAVEQVQELQSVVAPNVDTKAAEATLVEQNLNREAIYLFHAKKFQQALEKFSEIVEKYPQSSSAHTNLGMTYFRFGKLDEAKKQLLIAVQLNPNDVISYNDLGVVSLKSGDFFMAVSYFEKSIKLSPSFPDSHLNLGKTLEQMGKPERAIAEYQAYLNLPTGDPVVKKVISKRIAKLKSISRYYTDDQGGDE